MAYVFLECTCDDQDSCLEKNVVAWLIDVMWQHLCKNVTLGMWQISFTLIEVADDGSK